MDRNDVYEACKVYISSRDPMREIGESDFEDITQNVLYWMPIEPPKEDA